VMAGPDQFIEQGGQAELLKGFGLDAPGVVARVRRALGETEAVPERVSQPSS